MDNKTLRLEKHATNRFGLFLLIIVIFAGLGFGGYYLYKNWDKIDFDFTLPWEKNKDNNEEDEEDEKEENEPNYELKYTIPDLKYKHILLGNYSTKILIKSITEDNANIILNLEVSNGHENGYFNITCLKILVDGFDTNTDFEISFNKKESKEIAVKINKTELETIGIKEFNNLTFLLRVNLNGDVNTDYFMVGEKTNITLPYLVDMDTKNDVNFSFYKLLDDAEYYYFYFLVNNKSNSNVNILLKKFLVNEEIYDFKDFSYDVYYKSKKVFYIRVPKKEYKTIDNISAAFFLIEKKNGKNIFYITQEKEIIF